MEKNQVQMERSESAPKRGIEDFTFRVATVDDEPFFYNSWLESYRKHSPAVRSIPRNMYYEGQHEVIEKVLKRSGTVCLIACSKEDSNQILGYLIYEKLGQDLVFHWVYVKYPFREFGIARELERAALKIAENWDGRRVEAIYSHRVKTKAFDSANARRNYTFNPYVLRRHI